MTRVFTIIFSCICLAACAEEIKKIPVSESVKLNIYEGRIRGGGLADDMLKIYLKNLGEDVRKDENPVFEAENVGRVCYKWLSNDVLEIKTDGNNAYSIDPLWKGSDGRIVRLHFMGHSGCPWRVGDY